MKIFILIISCLAFNLTCFAQERCDYKFFGSIPTKVKTVGKAPDGSDIVDMYITDSAGNFANGSVCQYSGSQLVLKFNVINGKCEGIGKSWYNNGNKKWETEYKNGIPNGTSKYYYDDGKLDKVFNYNHGKAVSAKCSNGYKWTEIEVSKWNYGGNMRNEVRNICKKK